MPRRQGKRKRRILRAILLPILALVLFQVVGGFAPFARLPELSPENTAAIEARAEDMQADADSPDRATILEKRGQALNERLRLIHQARKEIVITTYDTRDSESTRDILCAALERADAGVKVRMLIDGMTGLATVKHSDLFRAFNAHENVEIRFYNPPSFFLPWRHMGRMHDKYVIVDDFGYILGGRNMFDHFLGEYVSPSGTYSNDREALVYNTAHGATAGGESSLHQVRDYFETIWAASEAPRSWAIDGAKRDDVLDSLRARYTALSESMPGLFAPADYEAMTLPTKGVWLVSNPINTDAKQPVVFATLCALMERAKADVILHSPYAVLNGYMRESLAEIADKVPVTLMINAVENGANVVASGDYLYHRGEVIATGMQVLEYAGGDSYHGKSLAIDDCLSVIGSFNLDMRSTYVDTELMLVIRGEEVNALLRSHMEALHADSRRVIDEQTSEVPDGLEIPPLSFGRKLMMRVIGGVMQLFRCMV